MDIFYHPGMAIVWDSENSWEYEIYQWYKPTRCREIWPNSSPCSVTVYRMASDECQMT